MSGAEMLILMAMLLIKHYIADFPLQFPEHYLNKGTYGHPGGIEHAFFHGAGTVVATYPFTPAWLGLSLGLLDMMVHYHVDWLKMNVCARKGWSEYVAQNADSSYRPDPAMAVPVYRAHMAIYSNHYFQAIGLDQLAHHMTYVLIAWLVIR